MTLPSPTVHAVTVTYRRPESLDRLRRAIQNQSHPVTHFTIVDNGGDAEGPEVMCSGGNVGPGGGFALGISRALESGEDGYVWVMDDDVEPELESLERLLSRADEKTICWPKVLGPDGEENFKPGWSGALVPMSAIRAHGVPRADYLWWGEDTEFFQHRLETAAGMESVRIPEAVVHHHHMPRRENPPGWKLYYQVRNATHLRLYLKKYNYWRLLRLWPSQVKQAFRPFPNESTLSRLTMVLTGIFDGITARLGARVPLP